MIEKPKGTINEIVYFHTTDSESQNRIYPNLIQLFILLDEILKADETTSSLHVTPFYVNEMLNFQEEFDIAHLYIETKENVTLIEKEEFAKKNMFWLTPESDYKILDKYINLDDMKQMYFLVEKADILDFKKSIHAYMSFLMQRGIPQMMAWLYDMYDFDKESIPYGYFCFEVLSH
ncbi:hypothetical protein [Streptococcus suis]|uniref:Uncharacterized protein n=1 Tax=Streptococcus suis TaxID=1307 RepID=A0A4T2GU63_STRSU|nr:hypothetical protein [Streptococcus suis]MBO3838857.1 hypothetical protein [Streptococcus suis]MBO4114467.1 hypothetical protein [Streptococcus suis]MDG4480878.1 hypothetical protein [Streptococcus suis]MDG4485809.1 hypothetical protein [Streptococcus suis]TII02330.1 hypothetical protein E8L09_08010 [Streptococcus suis]